MTTKLTLPAFDDIHMLVIGDIMIDRYIRGDVSRISPEAPVPVVSMSEQEDRLGGAANVCANLRSLGAQVTLVSIAGQDENFKALEPLLAQLALSHASLVLQLPERKTTVKTRVMAQHQHLLRIDSETIDPINSEQSAELQHKIKSILVSYQIDGIILQDYNKGLMTQSLIRGVINAANDAGIPTFVDPKYDHFFDYQGCSFFKPNKKELMAALDIKDLDGKDIHKLLQSRLGHKTTFVTLGKRGIFYQNDHEKGISQAKPRTISDVCGAGDTVISIASLCYCKGLPLSQISEIANIAGGQVCEQPGVAIVKRSTLVAEIELI
jgi:D-glycero-beta-D-manno-heptose-7-phosphate kinase